MNQYELMCHQIKVKVIMDSHKDFYDALISKVKELVDENYRLKSEIEKLKSQTK